MREVLARLYPTEIDSRKVVEDSGLDPANIAFDSKADNNWFAILDEASKHAGMVDAIVAVAREKYPDDTNLMAAVDAIRALPPEPATEQSATLPAVARPAIRSDGPSFPLIDRVESVAQLTDVLARVAEEQVARAVLLVGDSGVGKTRVAQEAVRLADENQLTVLQAQCIGQAAEALLPIRDCLSAYRGKRSVKEMLIEGGGPTMSENVPFVEGFLSVGQAGAPDRPLGGSRPGGVYEGLSRVLVGLGRERGLCLIVEDLTDADRDTLLFLEYLQRKTTVGHVLIVATVKKDLAEKPLNELLAKWTLGGTVIQEVPPLGRDDAAAFVALLPGGTNLDAAAINEIYAMTDGNPYFIELIVRDRADQAARGGASAGIPGDIQTVLKRRLALLKKTRPFVDAAAVALENTQSFDLIAHIAGVKPRSALALLQDATEKQSLREDAQGGVWFVQELLRRVVYDDLGPQARVAMHTDAAQWLEKGGLLASAAHHYARAGRTADLVRTALLGAAQAEYTGAYPKAADLYELAREKGGKDADPEVLGPRLANAYIVLGELKEASAVLDATPEDAPRARLLRSMIAFLGGDIERALELTLRELQRPTPDRLETQLWLAGIYLYLGQLETAAEHARQALAGNQDPSVIARCKGILGAAALFSGDIESGNRWFQEAKATLLAQPDEQRDRFIYATILGNLGQVRQARGDWAAARDQHEESLAIRREVSDARGILQSTRMILECDISLGAFEAARASLAEARELASRLGERVEAAKLDHAAVWLELAAGTAKEAVRLAESVLSQFRERGVAYDTAYARFSLAAACVADAQPRRAIEEGAAARVETERMGFGLLRTQYPTLGFAYPARIAAGLAATNADAAQPSIVRRIAGIVVATGREDRPRDGAAAGKPPLTLAGVDGESVVALGIPVGWAVPIDAVQERREWVMDLAREAGAGPEATCAACVIAACAAWSLEGAPSDVLLDVAIEEATGAIPETGADARLLAMLTAIGNSAWLPDRTAKDLEPYEAVARAISCIVDAPTLAEALVSAAGLEGTGTTVALIVGSLLGPREDATTEADIGLAKGIADLRIGPAGG